MRVIDVGRPSSDFGGWTTAEVRFHGFADLSTTRGEDVVSPEFACFGHKWVLDLYPGGIAGGSDDGMVAVYLSNTSDESIKVQFGLRVRDAAGKEVVHFEEQANEISNFNQFNH